MNKFTFEDLKGKVCVLTGGAGVIGASLARGLASAGVKTAIVDINEEAAVKLAAQVEKESGVKCIGISANVLDKESLEAAGFSAEFGQVTMKAENETELSGDEAVRMQKLIDALENLDDVQEVYTNVSLDE